MDATHPSVNITVDIGTNVNVDLKISGTDFGGPGTLTIDNAEYSTTYGGAKNGMSTTPTVFASNLSAGESQMLWHWLDVPSDTTAGNYSSIFTYQAVTAP